MKKNLLQFSFALLLVITKGYSQEFIPYYGTIVIQDSESNVLNKLTEFENLCVKIRGTSPLQNTLNLLKA